MTLTVGVAGASSQLGVFLLPRLLNAGFQVMAFSRRVATPSIEQTAGLSWLPPLAGEGCGALDILVSCGPLSVADAMVTRSSGLRQVIAFSTTSLETKADSANSQEIQQMASIQKDEDRLAATCAERGIGLVLLRPTLIYGCGLDQNISLLARFGRRFGFIPAAANATGLRQPVHADDLAALVINLLAGGETINLASAVCGGSTLSCGEMVSRIAACLENVRPLFLPAWVLKTATGLASFLPPYSGLNAQMVVRQSRDQVFDDTDLRDALGYDPRPFHPGKQDFAVPADASRLQLG